MNRYLENDDEFIYFNPKIIYIMFKLNLIDPYYCFSLFLYSKVLDYIIIFIKYLYLFIHQPVNLYFIAVYQNHSLILILNLI